MSRIYDEIGGSYARTRRPDPRIAQRIAAALGDADTVLNVGAGAGSYEPRDRRVFAVEPSRTMIRQRPAGTGPALQAAAEALPVRDAAVDAALAILTLHHWSDRAAGLAEMRRAARRRVVVLLWDQEVWESFWLVREYLPGIEVIDRPKAMPIDRVAESLCGGRGRSDVVPVPVPHDCVDGFHGAFWRRPAAYLDAQVRAGISTLCLMPAGELQEGLRRLDADLASGAWAERHRDLLAREELDVGYRLVVAHLEP